MVLLSFYWPFFLLVFSSCQMDANLSHIIIFEASSILCTLCSLDSLTLDLDLYYQIV